MSKSAEEVLKATALLGIFSYISNRTNIYYECSTELDLLAFISSFLIAIFFLWLGVAILIGRIKDLFPWIFFGSSLKGKILYVLMIVSISALTYPIGTVLLETSSIGTSDQRPLRRRFCAVMAIPSL